MIRCCVDKNRQSSVVISMFPPALNIEDITFISIVLLCILFLALTFVERQKYNVTRLLERKLYLSVVVVSSLLEDFSLRKTLDDLINDTGL